MSYTNSPVLFGRDSQRTRQTLAIAGLVFLASLVLYTSFPVYDGVPYTYLLILPSIPLIAAAMTVASAYRNEGLIVSALIPVMAVFGLELSLGIWLYFNLVPSYDPSGFGFVPLYPIVAFVLGLVLAGGGAAVRRLRHTIRS